MTVVIRYTSEIPDWFAMRNYSWTRQVSREDLVKELHVRAHMLFPEMQPEPLPTAVLDEAYLSIKKTARALPGDLVQRRVEDLGKRQQTQAASLRTVPAELVLPGASAVAPLTARRANDLIPEGLSTRIPPRTGHLTDPMDQVSFDALRYKHQKLDNSTSVQLHLRIDLSAGDAVILYEIQKNLPAWRNSLASISGGQIHAGKNNKAIGKINTYKLIPLLDLLIWAQRNEYRLADQFRRNAIFRGSTHNEDYVRKTVMPFLKRACRHEYILSLYSEARIADAKANFANIKP
jgi:hypothetical protein